MIFVIGALASGKRTYARGLGFAGEDFADAADVAAGRTRAAVAVDAQAAVRAPEHDVRAVADALARCEVVLFTEVGSGVVPLDAAERAWRERAGRLACLLAQRAEKAVRLVCGIPVPLQ